MLRIVKWTREAVVAVTFTTYKAAGMVGVVEKFRRMLRLPPADRLGVVWLRDTTGPVGLVVAERATVPWKLFRL